MNEKSSKPLDGLRKVISDRVDQLGVPARELSRRAGFNVGYLGDVISGRLKTPGADRIVKLAQALEMPPSELMAGEAFMPATTKPGLIPLYMMANAGGPIGYVPALPSLEGDAAAYAFTVSDESSAPRYFPGEIAYVSPAETPRPGNFVFYRLKNGAGAIGRIANLTARQVDVANIQGVVTPVATKDLDYLHRIVGSVG